MNEYQRVSRVVLAGVLGYFVFLETGVATTIFYTLLFLQNEFDI